MRHDELLAFLRARYAEREASADGDPERAADSAAIRRILDGVAQRAGSNETSAMLATEDGDASGEEKWKLANAASDWMVDEVLSALAESFASHPDYREGWWRW